MSRMGPREAVELSVTGSLSLNDLLWVANTGHGPAAHWHARPRPGEPDHDHLADASGARRYLADHGVPVPAGPPPPDALAGLRAARAAVAALIDGGDSTWIAAARPLFDAAAFGLDPSGRLAAVGDGWSAFVADLVPPLVAAAARRDRLGRCGNPACRLAFLDDTRNGARRWCDPGGCGNRIRVRRARAGRDDGALGGPVFGTQPPR